MCSQHRDEAASVATHLAYIIIHNSPDALVNENVLRLAQGSLSLMLLHEQKMLLQGASSGTINDVIESVLSLFEAGDHAVQARYRPMLPSSKRNHGMLSVNLGCEAVMWAALQLP